MKHAFTLIELMVVVAIVILITAISITGISSSRNRRQTKTTAENLKSFLTEARAQATSPNDTSFGLTSVKFNIQLDPNRVTWTEIGSTAPKTSIFAIPGGITIKNNPNSNMNCVLTPLPANCSFNFIANNSSTLGQLTNLSPSTATSAKIDVSNGSNTYTLDINKVTGLITLSEGT